MRFIRPIKVPHTKVWRFRKYREARLHIASEGTLGSSTDKNLGHNHNKIFKNVWSKFRHFRIAFSLKVVGPWYFLASFLASVWRGWPRTVVKTKIGQDLLIHNVLLNSGTVLASCHVVRRSNLESKPKISLGWISISVFENCFFIRVAFILTRAWRFCRAN
jgi:hypothetical protein